MRVKTEYGNLIFSLQFLNFHILFDNAFSFYWFNYSYCSHDDATNIHFSDEDEGDDPDWELKHPPAPKLRLQMTKEQAIKAKKSIVYNEAIELLLKAIVGESCKKCQDIIDFKQIKVGTCLVIKWKCPNYQSGHASGSWSSQPMLHGMHAGNLLVPSTVVLSGNNFAKIALMAKFLNLGFLSKAAFYR